MRLTLLAAVIAGLIAGVVGGVIVSVIDDDGGEPSGAVEQAVSSAAPVAAEARAAPLPINLAVERVLPGVVIIDVELPPTRDADGTVLAQGALGTGLVLNTDGYILTNEHVIRDGQRLTVILPSGEERAAQVVGTDFPFTDMAVLKIAPGGLTPVPFGARISTNSPTRGSRKSSTLTSTRCSPSLAISSPCSKKAEPGRTQHELSTSDRWTDFARRRSRKPGPSLTSQARPPSTI